MTNREISKLLNELEAITRPEKRGTDRQTVDLVRAKVLAAQEAHYADEFHR